MPTLSALAAVLTKRVTLFADTPEALSVTYYPGAFNSAAMESWNAIAERANAAVTDDEQEAAALAFGGLIARLIAGWDLTEADGVTPFPLTAERIVAEFLAQPLVWPAFLQTVMQAIAEDMSAGKATGTPSSANSAPTSSPKGSAALMTASLTNSASSSSRAGSKARQRSTGSSPTRNGGKRRTSVA
jgi:hypothetical protein